MHINPSPMSRLPILLLLALFISFSFSSCSQQPSNSQKVKDCLAAYALSKEDIQKISKEIHADKKAYSLDTLFQHKARFQGFNGSVLIAEKGVILYKNAFGLRDFSSKDSLTTESSFQLASISKTFTATGILLLAQDKSLKLEDTIQQYLPDFPYHGITIKNLLSHRSGLPNYLYSFEEKRKSKAAFPCNDTILAWFSQADSLPKPYGKPGNNFNYNNTNYMLLASIIEKVSGMSYAQFINDRIFEPLGMTHSFVDTLVKDSLVHLKTKGHQAGRVRTRDFYDGVYGDKGIYSTVEDMFKWYTALHSHCLLNKHYSNEAFTPRSFERQSKHNYGLGFRMITDPENMKKVHYVYHGGWWAGYSTMLWMDPKADFVIIILGNKKSNTVYEINPILEILESHLGKNLDSVGDEL